jgi:hypothetical protein
MLHFEKTAENLKQKINFSYQCGWIGLLNAMKFDTFPNIGSEIYTRQENQSLFFLHNLFHFITAKIYL